MSDTRKREHWNPLLKSYPFSEKINAVSIGAEVLFTRLIAQADDYGNYYGSPRMILASLFPHRWAKKELTETDVGHWRTELVTCLGGPLAALYTVNDSEYLHIINSRRRFRSDTNPDERFPREPETLEKSALSEYVTKAARKRTLNVPLDQDKTKTRPRQDQKTIMAQKLLDYLNDSLNRNGAERYQSSSPLPSRLKEGLTEAEAKLIIDYKVAEWTGTDYEKYLRPSTLFGIEKSPGYLSDAKRWEAKGRPPLNEKKSKRNGQLIEQRSLSEYVKEE